jgi:membrane-associated phospholipid phosphatase
MQSFIKRFNLVDLLTFTYGILTAVYILLFCKKIENPHYLLINRLIFFASLTLIVVLSDKFKNKFLGFVRYVFPFSLIAYWYPETYYLSHEVIFPNLDHFFEHLDIYLFGCSPAMEFSKAFPQAIVAEIMYFGYFSYFLTFLVTFLYFYFVKPCSAEKSMFYCLCSFFIFYIIFTFIPVAGPQFYYEQPTVLERNDQVPNGYIFSTLMRWIQDSGEKPTGAFPSSHVGLTIITMSILFNNTKRLFFIILPAAIILVASTVYIKAHYLIDVIAAFIVAPIIFIASKRIFKLFERITNKLNH